MYYCEYCGVFKSVIAQKQYFIIDAWLCIFWRDNNFKYKEFMEGTRL